MKKVLLLIIGVFFLTACSGGNNKVTIYTPDTNNQAPTVTYEKAKELIDNGAILIDVRTIEEYNEKHIEGSILLPLDSINEETVKDKILTKETTVIVYCRSGNRSSQAGIKLKQLGYTNVYDLGSIDNWK